MRERAVKSKVVVLLLVAAGILFGLIVTLGNVSFGKGFRLYVDFDFSGNIQKGAPVKVSGIKVGKVKEVRFLGGEVDGKTSEPVQVRVVVWIEERARDAIRKDAEFYVNTAGMLGEKYLEIVPGSREEPALDPGATVRGVDPPRTDLIVARLYDVLDSVSRLLHDDRDLIRDFLKSGTSVVRTLDAILGDNREQLKTLVVDLDKFTVETTTLIQSLQRGIGDAGQLRSTLRNMEKLSGAISREIDPIIEKTQRALDGVGNLSDVVGPKQKESLRKALDELGQISSRVTRVTEDTQKLVADLRAGKGTAGALLRDDQIYDDLREMVRDLKRNPWKFLWRE